MRYLLGTHALLWWLVGDKRLPRRSRTEIANDDNEIFVSAASAWEIATKHRLGKFPDWDVVGTDLVRLVAEQAFVGLDISLEHAQRAGALPGAHRDPLRVSNDAVFDDYGLRRIW